MGDRGRVMTTRPLFVIRDDMRRLDAELARLDRHDPNDRERGAAIVRELARLEREYAAVRAVTPHDRTGL